jgi:Arc/MetJ-type ribon-helix-helix transcriptional regulator
MKFDYKTPAELFMAKRKGGTRQPLGYRRFGTAAEAIRFAVEELPAMRTLGAWLQVGDERYGVDDIQRLYDNAGLSRKRPRRKLP